MKNINYDSDADAVVVDISTKKAQLTIELTEHILVDIADEKVVGLEMLDASEELSKLFGRAVSKTEIRQLLCQIEQKPNDQYLIRFSSPKKKEMANLLLPVYRSPLIS